MDAVNFGPFAPPGLEDETQPYAGAVDFADFPNGISGWAMARNAGKNPLRIEAVLAGEVLAETVANLPRPDISSVLGREADCGFLLRWEAFHRAPEGAGIGTSGGEIEFRIGDSPYKLVNLAGELTPIDVADAAAGHQASGPRADAARAINESLLFSHDFYLAWTGHRRDRRLAVQHYLQFGESWNVQPSPTFDVDFYRRTARGLADGTNLLHHYIRIGSLEARYTDRGSLAADAEQVMDSGLFDHALRFASGSGFTDIEQHLAWGWREGSWANPTFDDSLYWRLYRDVQEARRPPLLHFIDTGRSQFRITTEHALAERIGEIKDEFDPDHYKSQVPELPADTDPIAHYLTSGLADGHSPARFFAPHYYLRRYPDIAEARFEPFAHFLRAGRKEGRVGAPDFEARIRNGGQRFDHHKTTLVMVTPEAAGDRARLALALSDELSRDHNILHVSGGDGQLAGAMLASAVCVAVGPFDAADAPFLLERLRRTWPIRSVLVTSAEVAEFSEAALELGLPSVALAFDHPLAAQPGKLARLIASSDVAVLPSAAAIPAIQDEMTSQFGAPCAGIAVRPPASLPRRRGAGEQDRFSERMILDWIGAETGTRPNIVLGAGPVDMASGTDLFVRTAAEVRRRYPGDFRFLWVGNGYGPHESSYARILAADIAQSGLEQTVVFLPAEEDALDAVLSLADVFFSPARLSAYSPAAADALAAGLFVVCFDGENGIAEQVRAAPGSGAQVEYADIRAAAETIAQRFRTGRRDSSGRDGTAGTFPDFGSYADGIREGLARAAEQHAETEAACLRIGAAGAFNPAFYLGSLSLPGEPRRALKRYASWARKGLLNLSPRPGFHDGLYRNIHDIPAQVPLDHAVADADLQGAPPPSTHRCVILGRSARSGPSDLPIALHLHLFYSDLAFEFAAALSDRRHPIDLFITTTGAEAELEARYAFREFRNGSVTTQVVPNRGRDIGPFLTAFAPSILDRGYAVVGHLHGKRSSDVRINGEKWRQYLVNNLIGTPKTFSEVMGLFADDPQLGLVFAEDRHAVGWSANFELAQELAGRMVTPVKLPRFPCFPLGNMFWARPAALQPAFALDLHWSDYPPEPARYDGTVLHALERMWPSIAEAAGYRWATVYRPGTWWM